ncbi:hypothetical protein LJR034_002684 [Caballeronia sp. LjRoot34]
MILALKMFLCLWIIAAPIALLLGHFIQINRPTDMHDEWVRSGDSA